MYAYIYIYHKCNNNMIIVPGMDLQAGVRELQAVLHLRGATRVYIYTYICTYIYIYIYIYMFVYL